MPYNISTTWYLQPLQRSMGLMPVYVLGTVLQVEIRILVPFFLPCRPCLLNDALRGYRLH